VIDEDEEKVTHALNVCIQALTGTSLPPMTKNPDLLMVLSVHVYAGDHKASEDLHSFAKMNENRLFKLLKTCFNPQTDLKALAKASVSIPLISLYTKPKLTPHTHTQSDFLKRLSQLPSSHSSSSTLVTTLTTLLNRGSLHIINHASIPTLLKKLRLSHQLHQQQTTTKRRTSTAASLQLAATNGGVILNAIAKWCPGLGKAHFVELGKYVVVDHDHDDDGDGDGDSDDDDGGGEIALKLLANLFRAEKDMVKVSDKRTLDKIVKIALGRKRRLAKYAARVVVLGVSDDRVVRDVLQVRFSLHSCCVV
jgi:sister-chromatid-cohesion protein PDS5